MENLVLRNDVVTLKETTNQIKSDLAISIDEAVDIHAILRKHESSMQFWEIPSKGLPYKHDEPNQQNYAETWLDSRWWDQEHQHRQSELRELAGVHQTAKGKIEEMALLRKDAYRFFFSDALENKAKKQTSMPRNNLVSITKLLTLISNFSGGKVQIQELTHVFCDFYDCDRTMIYRSNNGWLCNPMNEGSHSGYNERADTVSHICNSMSFTRLGITNDDDPDQYLILKDDAVTMARQIWMKFFNENLIDPFESLGLGDLLNEEKIISTAKRVGTTIQTEIDPLDLPIELDAANMAFRAITNRYGNQSTTPRNRLKDYLKAHYPDFTAEQLDRLATVANPDKTTGRKKRDKE